MARDSFRGRMRAGWQGLALAALAGGSALLLGACGGGDEGGSKPPPRPSKAVARPPGAEQAQRIERCLTDAGFTAGVLDSSRGDRSIVLIDDRRFNKDIAVNVFASAEDAGRARRRDDVFGAPESSKQVDNVVLGFTSETTDRTPIVRKVERCLGRDRSAPGGQGRKVP